MSQTDDPHVIDNALQALAAALADPDPTSWVDHYTDDAVFDGGGERAVVGREDLLGMARSMQPLRSVTITPLRREVSGSLAVVWFEGSWVSGPTETSSEPTRVRGILALRREADDIWRVALERIG